MPKSKEWIKTKCYQYKKMRQVLQDLAVDHQVDLKLTNIKKQLYAHPCALLLGFVSTPLSEPLDKGALQNVAHTLFPDLLAATFYDDMAALYHWLGKHTNNDKKQQKKFCKVKAAIATGDHSEEDRKNLEIIFAQVVDWKKE
jgi:hypothetical protein